jgi:20S proteasome alpha/beta subunit
VVWQFVTVIIGLTCTDGVLLASDSMGSSGKIATAVQKARIMNGHPIVWGMSGSSFMIQQTERAVGKVERNSRAKPTAAKVADIVRETVIEAQQVPIVPLGGNPREREQHISEALILDWTTRHGASIIHVPADLAPIDCRDRPFIAIGSGHDFAAAVYETLAHHLARPLSLEQASLFAYRSISAVCRVSSWGVGLPVQMAVADENGARLLSSQDLEKLDFGVQRWLESDTESFRGEGGAEGGQLPKLGEPASRRS